MALHDRPQSPGRKVKRFIVHQILEEQGLCIIKGREARHISKVMRMVPGARLILMDAGGRRLHAVIVSVSDTQVQAAVEGPAALPETSPVEVILCQALLKSQSMDYLIQKTSELGVDAVLPFFSSRTVVRPSGEGYAGKVRRWREIALNAARQADRVAPARVGAPVPFDRVISGFATEDAFKVILWEAEGARDFKSLIKARGTCPRFIGVIGPEGGFSEEEIRTAEAAGFRTASLGRRILRAETAAMTVAAIVQYEWGDLSLSLPEDGRASACPAGPKGAGRTIS
jgi:16S rRNA (uracil1498-N3)-methyltransferase